MQKYLFLPRWFSATSSLSIGLVLTLRYIRMMMKFLAPFVLILLFSVGTHAQSQRKLLKTTVSAALEEGIVGINRTFDQMDTSIDWQADYHALGAYRTLVTAQLSKATEHEEQVESTELKWFPASLWDSLSNVIGQKKTAVNSIHEKLTTPDRVEQNELLRMVTILMAADTLDYAFYAAQGLYKLRNKRHKEALSNLVEAKQRGYNATVLPYLIGKAAFEAKKHEQAIPYFKQSLERSVAFDSSSYYLGESFYVLRNYDSAIVYIENITSVSNYWKCNRLGLAYREVGNHEEALANFDKATVLNGSSAEAWLNVMEQHLIMGNRKAADALLKSVMTDFPNNTVFLSKAMDFALERKDCNRVLELAAKIEPQTGYSPQIAKTKMKAFFFCKDYRSAQTHLNQVSSENLINKPYWQARIFAAQGEFEKADQVLQQAITKGTVVASIYAYQAALKKKAGVKYDDLFTTALRYGWDGEIPALP